MEDSLITQLVCTRLSHDIIGNIGAVANAVEPLEEGDMDFIDDIKSILKTSSVNLSSRLKFFRMAFGLANSNLDDLNLVKETAQNYLSTLGNKDFPIKLDFAVSNPAKRKTALLMIMVLADILLRGGTLKVYESPHGLIAETSTANRVSTDKLARIQNVIQSGTVEPDAGLAPLIALMDAHKPALNVDDAFIRLMTE